MRENREREAKRGIEANRRREAKRGRKAIKGKEVKSNTERHRKGEK